jgi:hypothetical protein
MLAGYEVSCRYCWHLSFFLFYLRYLKKNSTSKWKCSVQLLRSYWWKYWREGERDWPGCGVRCGLKVLRLIKQNNVLFRRDIYGRAIVWRIDEKSYFLYILRKPSIIMFMYIPCIFYCLLSIPTNAQIYILKYFINTLACSSASATPSCSLNFVLAKLTNFWNY